MEKHLVGKVTHYFNKIGVAVVELSDTLQAGDQISIEGPHTNLQQSAASMQIEHKNVSAAEKGKSVGLKVDAPVKAGDAVYKIVG